MFLFCLDFLPVVTVKVCCCRIQRNERLAALNCFFIREYSLFVKVFLIDQIERSLIRCSVIQIVEILSCYLCFAEIIDPRLCVCLIGGILWDDPGIDKEFRTFLRDDKFYILVQILCINVFTIPYNAYCGRTVSQKITRRVVCILIYQRLLLYELISCCFYFFFTCRVL